MNKKLLTLTLFAALSAGAFAQEELKVKITSRALIDAVTYTQNDAAKEQDGEMNEGVGVRDLRVGVKGSYGKWNFRAELSYTNNAVSAKDFYLQYNFNKNNWLRAGHYTVPFGLSSAYSSSKKEYMDEPEGNIYQPGRRIGIMHTISNKPLWFQYGVFADNSALTKSTDKTGPQGYTLAGRFVWRPIMTEDGGFHIGFSGMHVKAESTSKGSHAHIAYSKRYLTAVDKTYATTVDITDARWENKFTAEFQGIYHNWQLASQYYWSHVARDNNNSYNTDGFYVSARGIIVNPADYKYDYTGSGVSNPSNKNLELMLGYGYLDLNDSKAIKDSYIAGMANAGRMSDVSAGLSFFWNKYVTLRFNYHYIETHNWGRDVKKTNVFQFRVQYIF